MARIAIGDCPQCGAAQKIKESAVRANMRYTCRCGWAGTIHASDALVARADVLRAEGLAKRNERNSRGQPTMWGRSAGFLAIASVAFLVLAIIVPRLTPAQVNQQTTTVILLALSGTSALGWGLCSIIGAWHDVGSNAHRRRKRRRRRSA